MKNSRNAIKSHKFGSKKYLIEFINFKTTYGIASYGANFLMIQEGVDIKAIDSMIHEALHAMDIPDKNIHKEDGTTGTMDLAKFIQRWIKMNIKQLIVTYDKENKQ